MANRSIKVLVGLWGLLLVACASIENKSESLGREEVKGKEQLPIAERLFKERQDSLRKVLLAAKPNSKLSANLLEEFYLRGLVQEIGDSFSFFLPFNLHGFDCGAADCYSTDISFKILATEPLEFPEQVAFHLHEHGCVDRETMQNSLFQLQEQSSEQLNYFSAALKSNLILKRNGELYYYPHSKATSISVKTLDKMFRDKLFSDSVKVPYQSTVMTSNEYESFMVK